MNKTTQIPKRPTTVAMTPKTLIEVEAMSRKGILWKLGAVSREACRNIVREAILNLPEKYPNAWQLGEYRAQKFRLERLLEKI